MAAKKRTPQQTWDALERQARHDEIEHFLAMSDEEVDERLRAAGFDPEQVAAEGEALANKLSDDRERLAWQVRAAEGMAREQARVAALRGKFAGLSKAELVARIKAAKSDPRLAQPVSVMFRNRKTEEASEDELRAILEEIEALAEKKKE
jgi:hypothetical protein